MSFVGTSQRVQSQISYGRSGRVTPEEIVTYNQGAAAAGATIIYVNASDTEIFKIVDVRERHVTAGTNPILLRVHDRTVASAPGTAVNGTTIYDIVSIPTTGAANTWQRATKVGTTPPTITYPAVPAGKKLGAVPPGGTLEINVPATLATFIVEVLGIYL